MMGDIYGLEGSMKSVQMVEVDFTKLTYVAFGDSITYGVD